MGEMHKQEPFSRVALVLKTALLMGAGGGFLLATILTVAYAISVPLGAWWDALVQAHGHLQLYGWAGLFVLGIALHFLPRLRGTPLAVGRSHHEPGLARHQSTVAVDLSHAGLAHRPAGQRHSRGDGVSSRVRSVRWASPVSLIW